jgi:hypothetical protein
VVRALTCAAVLAVAGYALYVVLGPNFHTVIPGAVYRAAQPSGRGLERLVRRYGIRTVVNLRGCCDPLPWYLEECRAANRLNVSQEDIAFSSCRLPSVHAVRQLIEILDRSEFPLLFHCNKGADRSGLASAVALLLQTDTPLSAARAQLSVRYGHLSVGPTEYIDRFFDLYEEWLASRGLVHSTATFRRWASREYCPAEARCALEALPPVSRPLRVPAGRPFVFGVRCHNTSIKSWRMLPDSKAGIHAAFALVDEDNRIVSDGRAGLFEAVVQPGGHVDLALAVPAPLLPGRYLLRVDMVDEQHAFFLQTGGELLQWDVEVRP